MTSLCMKRLAAERKRFPTESSDFFVRWNDADLREFEAYLVGPEGSLYRHKFIKLKFNIPNDYPVKPPKVTFVQHTGERIHPNLYVEGKVCLSILGTWTGPPWCSGMTIHSVLTTIQSLLDDKPYTHEPGHEDNPEFNAFVQYNSWHWLLLEYLDREQDADAKAFLSQYLQKNATEMVSELERQKANHCQGTVLASPYNRGKRQVPDYDTLLADLKRRLPQPAELPGQLSGPSEAMQDTGLKRKLPFDDESCTSKAPASPAPKKRQTEVIDLTMD